jgi:peptide chain release factor 2
LTSCGAIFDVAHHRQLVKKLEEQTSQPDFWNDPEQAQKILQQRRSSEERLNAEDKLARMVSDIDTYLQMAKEETDAAQREGILRDADREITAADTYVGELETATLLAGESDRLNAILTIKPGAGGTESQDWAEMLLRMYLRWAERKGFRTTVIDAQPGEGAGLKSATARIEGENAYGLLSTETGVHRLIRISPFDQQARRHTSFASVFVIPEIDDKIEIVVNPDDLRIDTYRSGGKGGQNVNKVETAIRITHIPSGIVVQCQSERSQHQNRELAIKMLKSRLYEKQQDEKRAAMEKYYGEKGSIAWGNQIRSYVFQPYQMVKDLRTGYQTSDVQGVMDGDIHAFISAWLKAGQPRTRRSGVEDVE